MNTTDDIKKITDAIVKLSAYGAQKLAKGTAGTAIAIETTFANLKTGFQAIKPGTAYTPKQLALFIFQILSGIADLSKNLYVQDLESLAKQLYTIFTGGQGDFAEVWTDIQNLWNGKLKGLPAAEPNTALDASNLEQGVIGIFGYIISKLPAGTPQGDIDAIIAGICSGLDAVDPNVQISDDEAVSALYEVLDAIADLTGSHTPLAIEQILQKIWGLVNGNQSSFVKFFESISVAIEAKRLAKQASK